MKKLLTPPTSPENIQKLAESLRLDAEKFQKSEAKKAAKEFELAKKRKADEERRLALIEAEERERDKQAAHEFQKAKRRYDLRIAETEEYLNKSLKDAREVVTDALKLETLTEAKARAWQQKQKAAFGILKINGLSGEQKYKAPTVLINISQRQADQIERCVQILGVQ